MNVLIVGGNFVNQGAYLMLCATIGALRERFDAHPVLDLKTGTERQKRSVGADTLWTPKLARALGRRASGRVARRFGDRLPYLMASEIDAVLDISGFRYGDQWSHIALDKRADYLAYWSRHGVPVVMLPQAFGPFEQTAEASRVALSSARLVLARDPDSESYVRALMGDSPVAIDRFSDFTPALEGRFPSGYERLQGGVAIVPNWNIHERLGVSSGDGGYIQVLAALVRHVKSRGLLPYGVSHEGARDVAVLKEVSSACGGFEVVEGLNGVELKGLLGTARATVSGRFHALVSALSQGVPSVIHGWSHKYHWLAEDFAAGDLEASIAEGAHRSIAALDRALDDSDLSSRIAAAALLQKTRAGAMWDLVQAELKG